MLRNPKKTLQAINNCVTVALPLTSIDIEMIIEKVLEQTGTCALGTMPDIDFETEGVEDGSVLVYKAELQKWQSTKKLDRQIINAGEY